MAEKTQLSRKELNKFKERRRRIRIKEARRKRLMKRIYGRKANNDKSIERERR